MLTKVLQLLLLIFHANYLYSSTDFSQIKFVFTTLEESRNFLSLKDDYINNLSVIDLSLYHSTKDTVSITEHLEYLKTTPLSWNQSEKELILKYVENLKNVVTKLNLNLNLPKQIQLIKTNGLDAFNSHYTRGNAIIFPADSTLNISTDLATFYHEIFHIYSRNNKNISNDLYSIINFKPISRAIIPSDLEVIRTTNPDAFFYDHSVEIIKDNISYEVIPFMYSSIKKEDIEGPVNEALVYKLGLLDLKTINSNSVVMFKVSETNYKQVVSANSHYYIHPEEIMAENFKLLLLQNTPDIIMKEVKYQDVLDKLFKFLIN